MTMQIMDVFIVFGEPMDIVATTDDFFSPKEYGLKKEFMSTACWRGYWCKFTVDEENGLVLNDLHISPSVNKNVLLNGKHITSEDFDMGYYKDVELVIPFSGKVLFGKNQIYSVGSYMCDAAWGYEILIEMEFVEGKVVSKKDLSSKAKRFQRWYRFSKKLRNITEAFEYEDGTGDYNVKLWWLSYIPSTTVSLLLAPIDNALYLIKKTKKVLWEMKPSVQKEKVEQKQREEDKKYDESKFILLTKSLEDDASFLELTNLSKNAKEKKVLIISPEAYLSENSVITYRRQLENVGFERIEFANFKNVKRKNLLKFDCLFFPDGDPFALSAFIHFRLNCFHEIKNAVKRGAICIAVGESAVAMGEHIDAKHTKHPNSCFNEYKEYNGEIDSFGLGLFRGTISLFKSREDLEKELNNESEFFRSIHSQWPFREICLKDATICVVNGEKEWYK